MYREMKKGGLDAPVICAKCFRIGKFSGMESDTNDGSLWISPCMVKNCDSFICDDCRDEHDLSDHGILRNDPIEETPLELTCGRCHVVGTRADRPMKGIESLYICGAFETEGQGCQAYLCRKCQIPHAREVHPVKAGDPIGDPLLRCGSHTRLSLIHI